MPFLRSGGGVLISDELGAVDVEDCGLIDPANAAGVVDLLIRPCVKALFEFSPLSSD